MVTRNTRLEELVRDCLLIKCEIEFEYYHNENEKQRECFTLYFKRSNDSKFRIRLSSLMKIDFYINSYSGEYIGNLKCLNFGDRIALCLDPYDERTIDITEQDNMVIEFQKYEVEEI